MARKFLLSAGEVGLILIKFEQLFAY